MVIIKNKKIKTIKIQKDRKITLIKNTSKNKFIAASKKITEIKQNISNNLKKGNLLNVTKLYIALLKAQKATNTLNTKLSLIKIQMPNLEVSKRKRKLIEEDKTINPKQKELYLRLTKKQIDKKESKLITEIMKKIDMQLKK
jgi:hypothetical protein